MAFKFSTEVSYMIIAYVDNKNMIANITSTYRDNVLNTWNVSNTMKDGLLYGPTNYSLTQYRQFLAGGLLTKTISVAKIEWFTMMKKDNIVPEVHCHSFKKYSSQLEFYAAINKAKTDLVDSGYLVLTR